MTQITIIAGEASGDLHAAELVKQTHQYQPNIQFTGVGGTHMRQAGVNLLLDNKELAVVGVFEVIAQFNKLLNARRIIYNYLKRTKPDLLILVDFPGFNLHIARLAKKLGINTLFFISPQVWAWRKNRVRRIRRYINTMAVILPFEVDFYRQHNITAYYVGNPTIHNAHASISKADAYQLFHLDPSKKVVGLFPGSRNNEIKFLLPPMLAAAELIQQKFPDCQFVLAKADTISNDLIQSCIAKSNVNLKTIESQRYDVMNVCDAIITASGTACLEIALMQIPMVIIYKLTPLTYFVGRMLIHVKHIGLCNIIAGETVAQEFIQNQANANNISQEIIRLLENNNYRQTIKEKLAKLKHNMSQPEQITNIGKLVCDEVKGSSIILTVTPEK